MTVHRVPFMPALPRCVCERASSSLASVSARVSKARAWQCRDVQARFRSLDVVARLTHARSGFLFLAGRRVGAILQSESRRIAMPTVASELVRNINAPNACVGLGSRCMTPSEMVRRERARSVLEVA